MGRGGAIYFSYTALVLLSRATGSNAGLWDVDIDLGPAPPAASGPAFSAHASRNRDLLPFQIVGILGAYVGSVLIIGTLLLTMGRRLRKQALEPPAEEPTEMVKPTHKVFGNSPMSPGGSTKGWLRKKGSVANSVRSNKSNLRSPGGASVVTFDDNVLNQDRERQKEDLACMYAAVYAGDNSEAPPYLETQAQVATGHNGRPILRNLDLDRVRTAEPQALSPRSPTSPYRAIAPPKDILAQLSPRYKMDAPQSPLKEFRDQRTASYGSGRTHVDSPGKLRKKLGDLNIKAISSPIHGLRDNHDGAREPLSPRLYENPGPPPEPPSARTVDTYPYSPTTPGTARSYPFPEEDEDFDDVRDLPNAHPHRPRGLTNNSQPPQSPMTPGLPTSPAQFRVGSRPRRGNTPVGHVDRPLALRQFNEQQKQMQQSQVSLASPTAQQFPMSPAGAWNTRPAYPAGLLSPAIQHTVLQTQNISNGLTTAGGSAVPYSPFFPGVYTTPVTPHFTTRAERKQKEKEEKTIRGAITEEDQVPDESDLWRDGY